MFRRHSSRYTLGTIMNRKSLKLYLVAVPILLYLVLMYRMLESQCFETGNGVNRRDTNVYIHSAPSRHIMQISRNHNNSSSLIIELAKEYEILEDQKRHIIQTMSRLIDEDNEDYKDQYTLSKLKSIVGGQGNFNQGKSGNNINEGVPDTGYHFRELKPVYMINCTNIHDVRLKTKIGHGVSKQTFKSDFNGIPVAVKMVTRHQSEVKNCIENINDNHPNKDELRSRCFVFPTMKLMKEILLLEQLSHPGFAKLLGYCIRNEESDTTDLRERGIVSIFELGQRFMITNVQVLTWQQRIKHAMELADFLNYLEHSPLGSLRIRDFKDEHFLLINNSLKMIDLDDVDNLEPSCTIYVNLAREPDYLRYGKSGGCEFNLPCQRGLCVGFNAKQNMKFMNKLFFKRLLFPTIFPKSISQQIGALLADIDSNKFTASMVQLQLQELLLKT